jgi:hypothetical protein
MVDEGEVEEKEGDAWDRPVCDLPLAGEMRRKDEADSASTIGSRFGCWEKEAEAEADDDVDEVEKPRPI